MEMKITSLIMTSLAESQKTVEAHGCPTLLWNDSRSERQEDYPTSANNTQQV